MDCEVWLWTWSFTEENTLLGKEKGAQAEVPRVWEASRSAIPSERVQETVGILIAVSRFSTRCSRYLIRYWSSELHVTAGENLCPHRGVRIRSM